MGYGDEVIISVWGQAEQYVRKTLERDGTIFVENVGLLYLGGKTLDQVKSYVYERFGKVYSTLNSENPLTFLDVSIGKTKNINIRKAHYFFKNNIKETKEHNMIVDLERSDLSKICKYNTVKISKMKYVEEYRHLYHYVSEIRGKLKENVTTKDIITAMMPGGSVIGCPKISTLNLLNQQEKESRNIYTGSFGYINSELDMRFNNIIRTIINFKGVSEIAVASGVVIDSSAKKEFNENYIKAKSLINLFR